MFKACIISQFVVKATPSNPFKTYDIFFTKLESIGTQPNLHKKQTIQKERFNNANKWNLNLNFQSLPSMLLQPIRSNPRSHVLWHLKCKLHIDSKWVQWSWITYCKPMQTCNIGINLHSLLQSLVCSYCHVANSHVEVNETKILILRKPKNTCHLWNSIFF